MCFFSFAKTNNLRFSNSCGGVLVTIYLVTQQCPPQFLLSAGSNYPAILAILSTASLAAITETESVKNSIFTTIAALVSASTL